MKTAKHSMKPVPISQWVKAAKQALKAAQQYKQPTLSYLEEGAASEAMEEHQEEYGVYFQAIRGHEDLVAVISMEDARRFRREE